MNNYEQIIQQELAAVRVSGKLSLSEFWLLNQHTRSMAMLDLPTPHWAVVRWFCNQFNLAEAWYRWEQSGRTATAMQQLPPHLYQQAIDIVQSVNPDEPQTDE